MSLWASRVRWSLLAAAAVTVSLAGASCASNGPASSAPILSAPPGSADLLSTRGVVWSFQPGDGSHGVLISPDLGVHWTVALPEQGTHFGLVASYFLGRGEAWAVEQHQHAYGRGETTTVFGTTDGGTKWFRSDPLPGDVTGQSVPCDQIYFADGSHGWLLEADSATGSPSASGMTPTRQQMRLWSTSDGGHTWTQLPRRSLPLQNMQLPGDGPNCSGQPAVAFANPVDGWMTMGALGRGHSRPEVWRTTDGGRHWTPAPLAAPPGGWGPWADNFPNNASTPLAGRTVSEVGPARAVPSGLDAALLVPVEIGTSRLVIERSTDGGRTWQVASSVSTGLPPANGSPAPIWFDPIDASHWVISAPGELVETADAGASWTTVTTPVSLPGAPASFTSLGQGFVQGTGLAAALATTDGGHDWTAEESPPWAGTDPDAVGPAITTIQIVSRRLAVAAGAAGLETSSDGGRRWIRRLAVPAPVSEVDFVGGKTGFAVTDGELLRTRDDGARWNPIDQPLGGPASAVDFWSAKSGVADTFAGGYAVTRDGGRSWAPLRLPLGWAAEGNGVADQAPLGADIPSVCFARRSAAWVVASQGHRTAVLVSTDDGLRWRVAIKPSVFDQESYRPAVGITACAGGSAWVLVSHTPQDDDDTEAWTYDLLATSDAGRTWLDVLRTPAFGRTLRPFVAVPAGGPSIPAGVMPGKQFMQLAVAPETTSAFYTFAGGMADNSVGIGSTYDGGITWSSYWFQAARNGSLPTFSPHLPAGAKWVASSALDAEHAWMLFTGPGRSGFSYLFGTDDGGATWYLLKRFHPAS
jgi:photosystem II stability/assembly factor-like uncharacterized protein